MLLTKASVVRQLLVNLLHSLDVEPAALSMVDHRFRIVHTHNAVGLFLHRFWSVPWLIDVAVRIVF